MSGKTGLLVVVMALIAVGVGFMMSKDIDFAAILPPMSMEPH